MGGREPGETDLDAAYLEALKRRIESRRGDGAAAEVAAGGMRLGQRGRGINHALALAWNC